MNQPTVQDRDELIEDRAFGARIGDELFEFRSVEFRDRKVTGGQIAEAAQKHPVAEYVVLLQLQSGELETIRPTELVDLAERGIERLFVIKGDQLWRFLIDGLSMEWPRPVLTGMTIKRLARREGDDIEVIYERADASDQIVDDDDEVRIDAGGVEQFKTRPATRQITIFVDGEPYHPPVRRMTPNKIIEEAAHKDPSQTYLVQITHDGKVSYQGKGDEPIKLRDGMKFQVISVGPTPVSDPQVQMGTGAFAAGLKELGFESLFLKERPDQVVFSYVVQSGRFAGKEVRLGFLVPADFPMTPPTGPYVSPEIHPIKGDGAHPLGAVHKDQARPFDAAFGGSWQYWSRPFPDWPRSKKTVAAYMSHIWKLWDSQ